ncbi:MAG: hypothetical protein ACHQ6U_13105, partial [Thermodesulfobacteriota bacterium]
MSNKIEDDDSAKVYEEFDRWNRGPVVQFNYYLDDAWISPNGTRYHLPHYASFLLDPGEDWEIIEKIVEFE